MIHRRTPPVAVGPADVPPMPRAGLLALLGVGVLVAVCLLFGLGYSLYRAANVGGDEKATAASTPGTTPQTRRDEVAATAILAVDVEAGRTPGVAISLPPAVALPTSTATGAARVPAGFPHTPLGAAAQLAALEVHVLTAMSLPVAIEAYNAWALPGGVGAAAWSQTRNVQSFLTSARQQSNTKDTATLITVVPAGYQIKGTDGPDWLVACVLLDVHATIRDDARMGYGTCERMQWTDGRWLIAPGTPPAAAPSTWPGSDLSVKAGWQPLTRP
jgi:hypothetical protein